MYKDGSLLTGTDRDILGWLTRDTSNCFITSCRTWYSTVRVLEHLKRVKVAVSQLMPRSTVLYSTVQYCMCVGVEYGDGGEAWGKVKFALKFWLWGQLRSVACERQNFQFALASYVGYCAVVYGTRVS